MRLCWKLAQTLKLRKSGAKRWRENLLRKAASVWDLPGGPLMPSFPFLFLYPSTVLIWSWGSGPSQSPWLFHGRGTTLIIKSGTVLFFMCFNHTNTALSKALAFSFTLTALQSLRSRVSEQLIMKKPLGSSALRLWQIWIVIPRAINLTHSFSSIKYHNKTINNSECPITNMQIQWKENWSYAGLKYHLDSPPSAYHL